MNRRMIILGAAAAFVAAGPATAEKGWVSLFNDRDLTGWHVKDGKANAWKAIPAEPSRIIPVETGNSGFFRTRPSVAEKSAPVTGGMISCVAPEGGWLTSDKEYGDFVLRVEYRIRPGGNSGLGIRYPAQGDPAHVGMEIQILDDDAPQYAGKLKPAQYTGGIYYQSAATAKPARKPGEWNLYEVRAKGSKIRVKLNDVVIQDIDVDKFTTGEGGHTPLARRPKKGHIGFQSHGDPVDFRNIQIREL